MHAVVTIGEAILGFIVAIIISLVIGILMDFVSIIKNVFILLCWLHR